MTTPDWSLNTLTCAAAGWAKGADRACLICGRKTAASSAGSAAATSEAATTTTTGPCRRISTSIRARIRSSRTSVWDVCHKTFYSVEESSLSKWRLFEKGRIRAGWPFLTAGCQFSTVPMLLWYSIFTPPIRDKGWLNFVTAT